MNNYNPEQETFETRKIEKESFEKGFRKGTIWKRTVLSRNLSKDKSEKGASEKQNNSDQEKLISVVFQKDNSEEGQFQKGNI